MKTYNSMSIWFAVGSQHLYGEETLKIVKDDATRVVKFINAQNEIPSDVEFQGLLTTPDEINKFFSEAAYNESCAGIVLWMHTFSPAKMWINGLKHFHKPICHLHTQYSPEIPWSTIDMDYMNTHQSAHGGREFAHIFARLNRTRKIIVGHWKEERVIEEMGAWIRVVAGAREAARLKVARIEDNMREVAVTEGDKVSAQIQCGISINGFGVGDVVSYINQVDEKDIDTLLEEYDDLYSIAPEMQAKGERRQSLREAARIEIGLERFLRAGCHMAFTTSFESLHGLTQLPGMSVQRLMEKGYGFGGEGDWKVSALVRIMKIMGHDMPGGTSFMEDYIYHFSQHGDKVLGAHMLEICPSIGNSHKPNIELHPLGIGGKQDPVRMVFDVPEGDGVNVSWVDLGDRFRFIVNELRVEQLLQELPKLPVARALWQPQPNLNIAATAWMLAGGSHHTSFSKDVTTQMIIDLAEIFDIEVVVIDQNTKIRDFKFELSTKKS